ncbi:MAG: hypothetical protein OHK0029_06410 [Armatimonadaceae bacterium]
MATIRDCKKIQPLLSEFVDGTLSERDDWEVKMHVASCAVCAQIAEDFSATSRLLSSLPQPVLSSNFEAALAKRLADESLRPLPVSPWQRVVRRVQEAWHRPGLRASMTTGLALAALAPALFVLAPRLMSSGSEGNSRPVAIATPSQNVGTSSGAVRGTTSGAESEILDEVLSEHVSYASSEPFSNPSGLIPAGDLSDSAMRDL